MATGKSSGEREDMGAERGAVTRVVEARRVVGWDVEGAATGYQALAGAAVVTGEDRSWEGDSGDGQEVEVATESEWQQLKL